MKRLFAAALTLPFLACVASSSNEPATRSSSSADSTSVPCGCFRPNQIKVASSGSGSGSSSGGSPGSSSGAGLDECGGISCPVQTGAMTLASGQTTGVIELIAATAGPQTFGVSGLPSGVTATGTYNAPTSGDYALEVYNFVVATTTPDGGPYSVTFTSTDSNGAVGEYTLDLTPYVDTQDQLAYKPSDMYLHELVFADKHANLNKPLRRKMWAEASARLSTPLYIPAFVLFALLAVIGGSFSRLGYVRRIIVAMVAALLVRLLGVTIEAICENTPVLNFLQYLVPLVPGWIAGRRLFLGPRAISDTAPLGKALRPLGASA